MRGLVLTAAMLFANTASAQPPWFVRKECMDATSLAYAARIGEAMAKAKLLSASDDLDLRACGTWLKTTAIEMEIALFDHEDKLLHQLAKHLEDLEAFGREHGHRSHYYEDLILEAKLRRVHLLVRLGERTDAIRAVKESKQILEKRRRVKKKTPTYFYAEGIANLAITHADWPVRTILKLVGVVGDEERGTKAMKILLEAKTVYRPEAMVVARTFELGPKLDYSETLWREFPGNPVLAFNRAVDLHEAHRCAEVPSTLGNVKLDGYGDKVRKSVVGVLESCKTHAR